VLSRACFFVACILTFVRPSLAVCSLSTSTTTRIEQLRKLQDASTADFELGMAEIDTPGCLDAAAGTFTKLSNTDNKREKRLFDGLLAVANARKILEAGDRQAAIHALVAVAGAYPEFPAYLRAVHDLSGLLQAQPNAPEWQFLSAQLEKLAASEDVSGITAESIAQIAIHDIRTQHPDDGLSRMEAYLAKPHSVQIRLSSSILYLELLWTAGHVSNTQILCRDLDDDVGNLEIDPSMRVRFLQVCSSAFEKSSDPQGQLRYGRLSSALAAARGEVE